MRAASHKSVTIASPVGGEFEIWSSKPIRHHVMLTLTLNCVIMMLIGCSGNEIPTYPVEGHVVLEDGTPVQTGTVEFNSLERDITARGKIQSDGTFTLTTFKDRDGAVSGDHDAVVVQLISTEDLPLHEHDHGPTIDPKYAHYDSAGLRFTVHDDRTNSITITLMQVDSDSNDTGSPAS